MSSPPLPSLAWCIFVKEVRDLLRDRRAVLFAFVLPLLLYPLFFFFLSWKPAFEREELAARELRASFSGAEPRLRAELEARRITVEDAPLDAARVRGGEVALHVDVAAEDAAPDLSDGGSPGAKLLVTLYHTSTAPSSVEARRRTKEALDVLEEKLLDGRFRTAGLEITVADVVELELEDVATAEEASGAGLGRLLPLILVLLLLTGGSFAALDLVAGEKERGTLETLYVHPIPVRVVVQGKLLVILFASLLSVILNLAGMALAFALAGGVKLPSMEGAPLLLPPLASLTVVFLLLVPLALLTSAVLLALSAYARSYREAQTCLLPLTLLGIAAVLPALSPLADLASVVAIVPIANVALAVREAVQGDLSPVPCLVAVLSTSLYAALALRKAASLLEREDVVLRLEPPPFARDTTAEGRARRGVFFGAVMLLLVYFAGSLLQTWSFRAGLALTLWGVVLLPAVAYPLAFRLPWREHLGLRATRWENGLLAAPIAGSSLILMGAFMLLQERFLPMPEDLETLFEGLFDEELGGAARFALFALSPAICEELLWRGAVQGELEARGRPLVTVVTSAVFFGLFHLSVHRFLPTAMLGALLALVRLRTGSILPCILLHALYNGAVLWGLGPLLEDARARSLLLHPASLTGAAAVLVLSLLGLRRSRAAQP